MSNIRDINAMINMYSSFKVINIGEIMLNKFRGLKQGSICKKSICKENFLVIFIMTQFNLHTSDVQNQILKYLVPTKFDF